jgi:glutathione S-transferase
MLAIPADDHAQYATTRPALFSGMLVKPFDIFIRQIGEDASHDILISYHDIMSRPYVDTRLALARAALKRVRRMPDMGKLTAYHLPGGWGLPSVSPFCLKLDAFLKMTGIEHESVTIGTPFGGPKGKAPWIVHDGVKIGDSTLIILYLKEKFGVDPDAKLTTAQRGQAVAIERMVEQNLYWAMVNDRWNTPANWALLKSTVLGAIPAPLRMILAPIARRGVRSQLKGHGIGGHTREEIADIGKRDIDALAGILGNQSWYFGDEPTETDVVVFSVLANIYDVDFISPLKPVIARHANLLAFIGRFRERFYPAKT